MKTQRPIGCCARAPLPLQLYSRWEKILELRTGNEVGVEALLRGRRGPEVYGAAVLFGPCSPLGTPAQADRVARAVHMDSFSRRVRPRSRLFLNVFPETAARDAADIRDLCEQLAACAIEPNEVVVEVSERDTADPQLWAQAARAYRRLGCSIALDDFGATEGVLMLAGMLHPDIIKIDRSWLQESYAFNGREWAVLRHAHARKARICVEGIETLAHLERARALGAHWGQGFGLAQCLSLPRSAAAAAA